MFLCITVESRFVFSLIACIVDRVNACERCSAQPLDKLLFRPNFLQMIIFLTVEGWTQSGHSNGYWYF